MYACSAGSMGVQGTLGSGFAGWLGQGLGCKVQRHAPCSISSLAIPFPARRRVMDQGTQKQRSWGSFRRTGCRKPPKVPCQAWVSAPEMHSVGMGRSNPSQKHSRRTYLHHGSGCVFVVIAPVQGAGKLLAFGHGRSHHQPPGSPG